MAYSKKIAVQIQSEVQFFSLGPLIHKLKEKGFSVDVIVDDYDGDQLGYNDVAAGAKRILRKHNIKYKNIQDVENFIYDICLLPYMDDRIKAKRYLKYEYGTLNIKPNLTYLPHLLEGFHGFLCQSKITYELLKVYGATFLVDNLRFCRESGIKIGNSNKKRLLFAPTYNDLHENEGLEEVMKKLKENYYLIVKGHHGTSYLKENIGKKQILGELADEYYGSDTSLSELITKVDVCLFDNSSAIGEALYAKVPCAIFTDDLDYFKLGEIHTTQYGLVKFAKVPWTDKIENLNAILKKALSKEYRDKQMKLSDEIFPDECKTGVEGYIRVIDLFLSDPIMEDYSLLHDYALSQRKIFREEAEKRINDGRRKNIVLKNENDLLKKANERLENENKFLVSKGCAMKERIKNMESEIEDNKKKKLYRLADKLYNLEGKILNGKS